MTDARRQLKSGTGDARLMGVLFTLLSVPVGLAAMTDLTGGWAARLLMLINALILIGPGVWYVFASHMMRQLNAMAARISIRVAAAQLLIIAGCIIAGIVASGRDKPIFLLPAILALFLVPALIALMFVLRRVHGLIGQLDPGGHAFEAIPMAQILPDAQPIDSDRPK